MASFALLFCFTVLCVASTIVSGGKREKTPVIPDIASTAYSVSVHSSEEYYRTRVRNPDEHISKRLFRYFVFGGILQRIAEETEIPRADLVQGGASQYQDQSSQLGPEYHAAHVIRVGKINEGLKQKNKDLFKALANYIGHTHNVVRLANVWHGVAGKIDKFQSDNLGKLAEIDFTGVFEPHNRQKVEWLTNGFRDLIVEFEGSGTRSEIEQKEVRTGTGDVWNIGYEMVFNYGKEGHELVRNGTFKSRYAVD